MLVILCFLVSFTYSGVQSIAVGEPNPSAPGPTCPHETYTCPDEPPVTNPEPRIIPGIFFSIFQHFNGTAASNIAYIHKVRAKHHTVYVQEVQSYSIVQDPCELLSVINRFVQQISKLVLDQQVENSNEFVRLFGESFIKLKSILGDVMSDTNVQCALQKLQQVIVQFKNDLVNNANCFVQSKRSIYQQFTIDLNELHQKAVNSDCPKEQQNRFVVLADRLTKDFNHELEVFLANAHHIVTTAYQVMYDLIAIITKAKIAAVTWIFT